eukprot:2669016-Amphidinium_carterae.1
MILRGLGVEWGSDRVPLHCAHCCRDMRVLHAQEAELAESYAGMELIVECGTQYHRTTNKAKNRNRRQCQYEDYSSGFWNQFVNASPLQFFVLGSLSTSRKHKF